MRIIKKGATSQSLYFEIMDSTSTSGGRLTTLVFNTSGLQAWYTRNGAAAVQIAATGALITQTATGAWTSGGFTPVSTTNSPGLYRLDVPNAAFASGVDSVVVTLFGATGMVQVSHLIQLVSVDLQDATAFGLTNLDATVSSRLATSGYTAPLTAATTRSAVGLASANLDTQLSGIPESTWDVTLSSHLTGGTTGNALNASGSAGDPWVTALPGAYGAGSAGNILGNNLNATVSSRLPTASITLTGGKVDVNDKTGFSLSAGGVQAVWDALTSALTTVGSIGKTLVTNVDATISSRLSTAGYTAPDNADILLIKAKTDNLPASPAAVGSAMTLTSGERTTVADSLLDRDMSVGVDSGSPSVRTVRQALRFLRNKFALSGTALTVYKEDDTTSSWTSVVGTDPTANPVISSDPA